MSGKKPVIAGLAQPILNQLRPELDFSRVRRPSVKLALDTAKPVHSGQFDSGAALQEIKFAEPAQGRYFCLESLNAHDGKAFAAVAELDLLDESGKPLSHEGSSLTSTAREQHPGGRRR